MMSELLHSSFYTESEDSITRLFAAEGIRILRQERALIQSHDEVLNLIRC